MNRNDFGEFAIEMFSVEDLLMDPVYQRHTDVNRARLLANNFNPKLFDPVTVSERDDGMYIVDGGHRLMAATILGIEKIPGIVSRYEGLAEEAGAFVTKNRSQKDLKVIDRYRGELAAGELIATDVNDTATAVGLPIPTKLKAVAAAVKVRTEYGPEILYRTLSIASATAHAQELRYAEQWLIVGLGELLARYPLLNDARLKKVLATHYQVIQTRVKSAGQLGSGNRGVVSGMILAEYYDRNARGKTARLAWLSPLG
jgi:ParB-like nuclease domain